ncbi:MAG: hypothetical protein QM760_00425 [Nibricoccus sp.]
MTVRENHSPASDSAGVGTVAVSSPSSLTAPQTASAADEGAASSNAIEQAPVSIATNVSTSAQSTALSSTAASPSEESSEKALALQTAPEPSLAQVILGLEGTTENDARPQYQTSESPLLASLDILGGVQTQRLSSLESTSPLSQVSLPRDDRRARLLASVDSQERGDMVAGNSRVARSRERIANRLAEQSLYDSISRLGLNGDSVSIKF